MFSHLTTLDLTSCRELCDLEPLKGLQGLERLDLRSCGSIVSIEPLRGMTRLKRLDLAFTEYAFDN